MIVSLSPLMTDSSQEQPNWPPPEKCGLQPAYRRLHAADRLATELHDVDLAIRSQGAAEQKYPRKPMLMQIRAGLGPDSCIHASACSTSAIRSLMSSIPTEKRTRPSEMPSFARFSGGIVAWVMIAGC